MDITSVLVSKPLLIGLHLGFAIIGIDLFLWLLGEVASNTGFVRRRMFVACTGFFAYLLTWIIGGYYYVKFYGPLVKPIIKEGNAPWAHAIAMEAKENIFLFAIPLAVTIYFLAKFDSNELQASGLRKQFIHLLVITAGLGLSLGLMGFIISAAARWGVA